MSYNKTIWKPGDIITTDKWNNLANNVPGLKIIQIPFELIENEGTIIGSKLLVTSEQLNNYIKNGYLCYYINDNIFYYYFSKRKQYWSFRNHNTVNWYDKGNGYLETILSTPAAEEPSGPIK